MKNLLAFLRTQGLESKVKKMLACQYNETLEESLGQVDPSSFFTRLNWENSDDGLEFWREINEEWKEFRKKISF